MPQKIQKRLRLILWVFLPLFLLSFIASGLTEDHASIEAGTYQLKTMGATDTLLEGEVVFIQEEVISNKGDLLSVLKLNFNAGSGEGNPIQFLISADTKGQSLTKGTYKISRYISGFISNFNGVFGYANLGLLGEKPYFTRKGQLIITDIGTDMVSGTLDVFLSDENGSDLHLQGHFNAHGN